MCIDHTTLCYLSGCSILWSTELCIEVEHTRLASAWHYAYDVIEMCAPLRRQRHLWSYRSRTLTLELTLTHRHPIILRPSSLGGGRILRRTLSVRLSVRPVIVAIGNVFSSTGPLASRMHFSARTEGRISYGHLGRTDSCIIYIDHYLPY